MTNEKLNIRRRAILNAYGDPKLADRARKWSDDRIRRELAITVPDTLPAIHRFTSEEKEKKRELYQKISFAKTIGVEPEIALPLNRKQIQRKAGENRKIAYALSLGLDPETARKLKTTRKELIQNTADFRKSAVLRPVIRKGFKDKKPYRVLDDIDLQINDPNFDSNASIRDRAKQWAKYSVSREKDEDGEFNHMKNFPPELLRLIRTINRNTENREGRLPDFGEWGFAVAWNMYVYGRTYQETLTRIRPEDFTDEYKKMTKAIRSAKPKYLN